MRTNLNSILWNSFSYHTLDFDSPSEFIIFLFISLYSINCLSCILPPIASSAIDHTVIYCFGISINFLLHIVRSPKRISCCFLWSHVQIFYCGLCGLRSTQSSTVNHPDASNPESAYHQPYHCWRGLQQQQPIGRDEGFCADRKLFLLYDNLVTYLPVLLTGESVVESRSIHHLSTIWSGFELAIVPY